MSSDALGFAGSASYRLMPFRFGRMGDRVLMTNDGGEFAVIARADFDELVSGNLTTASSAYLELESKTFITHGPDPTALRVRASQWRTKKAFLEGGPKLHIFVPTLRCNQSCGYCQASRADAAAPGLDMGRDSASRAIDIMLAAPSGSVVMEFQGGEPLLAFDLVKWMTETTAARAAIVGKSVNYVICTNLTLLTDEHLEFFKAHDFAVSTSIDGPADLHNRNRPMRGTLTHDVVVKNIHRCHEALGDGSVSALMTTTVHSLGRAREIIDEYVALGIGSIFLRELNPYGYAAKSEKAFGYSTAAFIEFFREALKYIIDLNRRGTVFSESFTTVLLRKILTPFGVGFVDLQSPTGEGFGVVLYNHDGGVYASDESRMLAEMGDQAFRLGSVDDGYQNLFFGDTMQCLAAAGCAEALPGCSDCVYVPYCGADPVRHYRTQGDLIGHRPSSSFCHKHTAIFEIIFDLLVNGSPETREILFSWVNPGRYRMPRPSWLS